MNMRLSENCVVVTTRKENTFNHQHKIPKHISSRAINSSLIKSMLKPSVFVLLLLPFVWLVFALLTNRLGANPIEVITLDTGEMALRMLLLSLAMTPLRILLKKPWPIRLRRMIGLFAFFYAAMHFLTYLVLDQQLDLSDIISDVFERPYITAGTAAFLMLVPLAATSTTGMMKRLGRRWQPLHRLVYMATTAVLVHYIWVTKGEQIEPIIYLFVLFALLLFRVKKLIT